MWLEQKNDLNVYKEENTVYGAQVSFEAGVERPLSSLSLYGHSTQVTTTGAQLLHDDWEKSQTSKGVTISLKNCMVSFKGTMDDDGTENRPVLDYGLNLAEFMGKTLSLVSDDPNLYLCFRAEYSDGSNEYGLNEISVGDNIVNMAARFFYRKTNPPSGTVINETHKVMLCESKNKELPWEPYTGGKPSPSPEYPQEITNVGDDGNVEVNVCGGNIAKYISRGNINTDGSITYDSNGIRNLYVIKATHKTIFSNQPSTVYGWYDEYPTNRLISIDNIRHLDKKQVLEVPDRATFLVCGVEPDIQQFMANIVSPPQSYEPYKEPQSLTISTPNGLPGIPVSDSSNYTDSTGQHWICDEIDFGRGKYVQRVKEINPADYDNWILDNATDPIRFKINIENTINERKRFEILSNRFIFGSDGVHRAGVSFTYSNELYFYLPSTVTTVEQVKQWFIDNPTTSIYILGEPIERDLTPEEIASYKSIQTYRPTTVISSDAWMQVGYYTAYMETKTNWKSSDFFNVQDYNRIKRNLNDTRWLALTLWPEFTFEEMGEDKSYEDYSFYADEINRFEANVEHICQGTFPFQVGERQTFYDNTPFIGWQELNRLEEACRMMYSNIKSREQGRRTLPFSLNGGVL